MITLFKLALFTLLSSLVASGKALDNFVTVSNRSFYEKSVFLTNLADNISTNQPVGKMAPVLRLSRRAAQQHLKLPTYQYSKYPLTDRTRFTPLNGTWHEESPDEVIEVLLPVTTVANGSTPSSQYLGVQTLCRTNKMLVQVKKTILGSGGLTSEIKLGTCQANKATKEFLYFEYDLDMCGSTRTMVDNWVTYTNTLRLYPPTLSSPIRRALPFNLTIGCHYNRYHYSHKIGYKPKTETHKVFKPMKNRSNFVLTPKNAQWENLGRSDGYVIGRAMRFEAEAPSMSQDERLYIHSCHVTVKKSHTSTPQFPVIENFGCMSESKGGHSKFIRYKDNAVRFSVDAFIFKDTDGQQLYMHCTMSVGRKVPTPTAKSCNYDNKASMWKELYSATSVCDCCDSECSSAVSSGNKMVTSRPWSVEYKVKSTNVIEETATVMTTSIMTKQPQPHKGINKVNEIKVGEWPLIDVGWMTDQRHVRGSVVVEQVSEPQRIFEDVFGFDA